MKRRDFVALLGGMLASLSHANRQGYAASQGSRMPTFVCQLTWTDEGVKDPLQIPLRRGLTRSEVGGAFNVDVKQVLYMSGDTDILMILEAPDHEAVTKWALAIASNGHVRPRISRAFNEEEFDSILEELRPS